MTFSDDPTSDDVLDLLARVPRDREQAAFALLQTFRVDALTWPVSARAPLARRRLRDALLDLLELPPGERTGG